MNILLFTPADTGSPLPRADARAIHLLEVLRRREGDTFDAGLIDGPRGKGTLIAIRADALELTFTWGEPPPPLDPITLIVGLPRPQTARKILNEAATLGVSAIHFAATGRGEASYAQSSLWTSGEWKRHLVTGAGQAFCTRLPEVTWSRQLAEIIAALPVEEPGVVRLALDNYEASEPLSSCAPLAGRPAGVVLVLGSERGWTEDERRLLRENGFALVHLGARVLRTETAVVASVAIVKARLGLL